MQCIVITRDDFSLELSKKLEKVEIYNEDKDEIEIMIEGIVEHLNKDIAGKN